MLRSKNKDKQINEQKEIIEKESHNAENKVVEKSNQFKKTTIILEGDFITLDELDEKENNLSLDSK